MSTDRVFQPLVSIVIPVFNGQDFLHHAIQSALDQTYPHIEVLVVNDGSTDETEAVARSFGNQIRYLSKTNGGTSTALNLGIQNMRGDYFCWLSHDDSYHPENISKQVARLAALEDKTTITLTDVNCIDENSSITIFDSDYSHHRNLWPPRWRSRVYPVLFMGLHGCQIMFHRTVFDKVGIFNEEMRVAQDYEFFGRAFRAFPHSFIPEVLGSSRDSGMRQGRRLAGLGTIEYSEVFIRMIEALTDQEILELAPSRIELLKELKILYQKPGYQGVIDFIDDQLLPHIHLNITDLKGRGFNGYDLIENMGKRGVDGYQLVWNKESKSEKVFSLRSSAGNRIIADQISKMEDVFSAKTMISPIIHDLLYHERFLEAKLIHLHLVQHPGFNLHYLPIISRLKPIVWSLHDPWSLTGHCIHPGPCERWKMGCGDCPDLRAIYEIAHDNTALQFELKKHIVQSSDLVIHVASRWMRQRVLSSPIFGAKEIVQIPFGVDQDVFCPGDKREARLKIGATGNGPVLLARSQSDRDSDFKGMSFIRNVVSKLSARGPLTLVTVGEIGNLKGLPRNVKLVELGWVSEPARMADTYRASDLFLMPSLKESFGLMAIEAMSSGLPVLALDVPDSALRETISSPQVGLAVKPEEYVNAAERLLFSEDDLKRMSLEGREFSLRHHNLKAMVDDFEVLYRRLVSSFQRDESAERVHQQLVAHREHYRIGTTRRNRPSQAFIFGGIDLRSRTDWRRGLRFLRRQGPVSTLRQAWFIYKQERN